LVGGGRAGALQDVKLTISKENYLKAIAEAAAEGDVVITASLARWLQVSPPAATMALQRLKRDKLVQLTKEGRVSLTEEGRRIADRVVYRHHLIERMLTEVFGMEWYKVHDEAERLEHAVSADFEAKLVEKLGRGGDCPHGNTAAPESPATRRKRGLQLLSEAEPEKSYTISSVFERDRQLLNFLEDRAMRPGARVHVNARNYDQTVSLTTDAGDFSVGRPVAEKVWVSPGDHKLRTRSK
jgi:DtxR family Mn-dependent transcriptional regulator